MEPASAAITAVPVLLARLGPPSHTTPSMPMSTHVQSGGLLQRHASNAHEAHPRLRT